MTHDTRMRTCASMLVLVGLMALAAGVVDGGTRCTFPGKSHRCSSPRGSWEVEWTQPAGDRGHVLSIKRPSSRQARALLVFSRHVDLLWSGDDRALAITDHVGSDESDLWVFTGPALETRVNVEDMLRESLGAAPEIFDNGHRYLAALEWLRSDLLRFQVRAYDSEPGKEFRGRFRYRLSRGVTREQAN
jgi:hypothetical protein